MVADGFKLKTERDYDFFEVTSSLQKCIRRGLEYEALYWAMELLPRFEEYFWRRMKIIVNEDIGIANPLAIILVQVLAEQYFELRKRGDMGCTLMVSNIILYTCRGKKTRIGEHIIDLLSQREVHELEKLEIPDFALDMHTRRGKEMKRWIPHFEEEGAKLVNEDTSIDNPYQKPALELELKGKSMKNWPKPTEKAKKDDRLLF